MQVVAVDVVIVLVELNKKEKEMMKRERSWKGSNEATEGKKVEKKIDLRLLP
jgi:hypothetical protein